MVIYEKKTTDTLCQTVLKRKKNEKQNILLQMKDFHFHVQDYIYTH